MSCAGLLRASSLVMTRARMYPVRVCVLGARRCAACHLRRMRHADAHLLAQLPQRLDRDLPGGGLVVADDHCEARPAGVGPLHLRLEAAPAAVQYDASARAARNCSAACQADRLHARLCTR